MPYIILTRHNIIITFTGDFVRDDIVRRLADAAREQASRDGGSDRDVASITQAP